MPMLERDEAAGFDRDLFPRRRFPDNVSIKRAGSHIEPAIETQYVRMRNQKGSSSTYSLMIFVSVALTMVWPVFASP